MKRLSVIFVAVFALVSLAHSASAAHKRKYTPQPDKYASLVMDAATGVVLSEKNADDKRYPASLTKMMTLYLAFEALDNGRLSKNQRLRISTAAEYQSPSKLGLKAGYTIRAEDAILAIVTKSANDAAVVLGENLAGGSEARFALLMNAKARHLGMTGTHFVNASGLHDPGQYSTARDMAKLALALMRDYPRYYHYFSTPEFTYAGISYNNHNKLLNTYPGMDGLKTGYVGVSGYNLAASAVQNGHRLIGIVFGGKTAASRNKTMTQLLDAGFARLREPRIASSLRRSPLLDGNGVPLPRRKPVSDSDAPAFNALALVENTDAQQGDSDADDTTIPANRVLARRNGSPGQTNVIASLRPRPMNTTRMITANAAEPNAGQWAIQVGAFSNQSVGLNALRNARNQLPEHIVGNSTYVIVPLMTSQGTIYRARLVGMDHTQAAYACRVLQGSCLILAAE